MAHSFVRSRNCTLKNKPGAWVSVQKKGHYLFDARSLLSDIFSIALRFFFVCFIHVLISPTLCIMKRSRCTTRKYDLQKFAEILEAITSGKYTVKRPDSLKYRQTETWDKWRMIYDDADQWNIIIFAVVVQQFIMWISLILENASRHTQWNVSQLRMTTIE